MSGTATERQSRQRRHRLPNKKACARCRRLKRKCDGLVPCSTCARFRTSCSFSSEDERHHQGVPTDEGGEVSGNIAESYLDSDLRSREELTEAASGLLSFRRLARREDPLGLITGNATAFNLRINSSIAQTAEQELAPIDMLLGSQDAKTLSLVYFQAVNPVFGIVSVDEFDKYLSLEYAMDGGETAEQYQLILRSYRPILFGVLALGSLFSRKRTDILLSYPHTRDELERKALVQAKYQLDSSELSTFSKPNALAAYYVTGQVLRLIYLRATAPPATAWLCCCKAMHAAEMVNLHDETKWDSIDQDKNHLRHIFWALEVLNNWLSLEVGCSKVYLAFIRCEYPKAKDSNDFTPALVDLYHKTRDIFFLGESGLNIVLESLKNLMNYQPPHPELSLDRSYSAIIIFRRLRLVYNNDHVIKDLVAIACDALHACRELAKAGCPWWHVANVPFQLLAMIIMIDKGEFSNIIAEILHTMAIIAKEFGTKETSDMLSTAKNLLRLFAQRKENDASAIYANIADIEGTDHLDPELVAHSTETDLLSSALDIIMNRGLFPL